jgi:YggT family protein
MNETLFFLSLLFQIFRYIVVAVVIGVIALMLLRLFINYADFNPFSRPVLTLRRITDPLVNPVRGGLLRAGFDARFTPLLVILITILIGYFAVEFVGAVVSTIIGVLLSVQRGAFVPLIGYLLYGALAIYALLIFVRIVFSYGLDYSNRVMRFLIRATEPVLAPFRRLIPPIGMFDISPIVVLFLLQIFQRAIEATMLSF